MPNNETASAAIESLRTFAVAHGEHEFSHLCTAALGGEEWAVERVEAALYSIARTPEAWSTEMKLAHKRDVIRATDTSHPAGGEPKSIRI